MIYRLAMISRIIAILIVVAITTAAQSAYSITGRVIDNKGQPLSGVAVAFYKTPALISDSVRSGRASRMQAADFFLLGFLQPATSCARVRALRVATLTHASGIHLRPRCRSPPRSLPTSRS